MRLVAGLLLGLTLTCSALAQDRTQAFLLHASAVNRFQLSAAQLALKKSQSPVVHGLAHQLKLDYTAAGMKLRHIVADSRLTMPRETLDAPHKELMDTLGRTAPGKTLSRAYFEAQEKTLPADLAIFEAYGKSGDNDRLMSYAKDMLPLLRGQIEQVAKLRRELK